MVHMEGFIIREKLMFWIIHYNAWNKFQLEKYQFQSVLIWYIF